MTHITSLPLPNCRQKSVITTSSFLCMCVVDILSLLLSSRQSLYSEVKSKGEGEKQTFIITSAIFCGQLDAFDVWQKSAYLVSFLLLIREWWRAVFTAVLSANKRVICEPLFVRFTIVSYVFVSFSQNAPHGEEWVLIKNVCIIHKGNKRRHKKACRNVFFL